MVDWDGYTIGYYGRIFEARNKPKGSSFEGNEKEYFRFRVGQDEVRLKKTFTPTHRLVLLPSQSSSVSTMIHTFILDQPAYSARERMIKSVLRLRE